MDYSKKTVIDYSVFTVEEVRGALWAAYQHSVSGTRETGAKVDVLGAEIKRTGNLGSAIKYCQERQNSGVRSVTPFNVGTILAGKFDTYVAEEKVIKVQGSVFPKVAGFLSYEKKEEEIKALLPGSNVVPFNTSFAVNVALVAGTTKYVVVAGQGKIVAIVPAVPMHSGRVQVPFNSSAFVTKFTHTNYGRSVLQGSEWASALYVNFYSEREEFKGMIASCYTSFEPKVIVADKWSKLYDPKSFPALNPETEIAFVKATQQLQGYRGKDNSGISAMTYAAYGEDFTTSYSLTEKMARLRIFLNSVPKDVSDCPVRYMCDEETEGTAAIMVIRSKGFRAVHYFRGTIHEVAASDAGRNLFSDKIVFDPRSITPLFSGKLKTKNVESYIKRNQNLIADHLARYSEGKYVCVVAHVLGMEDYVVGMAAPHNHTGVIGRVKVPGQREGIWRLIMYANVVRNTYLYHRTTLKNVLLALSIANLTRASSNLKTFPVFQWSEMIRAPSVQITKSQREVIDTYLKEEGFDGDDVMNLTDMEVLGRIREVMEEKGNIGDLNILMSTAVAMKAPVPIPIPKHTLHQAAEDYRNMDDLDVELPMNDESESDDEEKVANTMIKSLHVAALEEG